MEFQGNITGIGDCSFCNCSSLAEIRLPSALKSIGNRAFYNCALMDITIPGSLTSLGSEAFANCKELAEIHFPDTGLPNYQNDEGVSGVFENCTSLVMVTIPDGVKLTSQPWFVGCSSLVSIQVSADAACEEQINQYNSGFQGYDVDTNNVQYASTGDGILLSKSGDTLFVYPGGKADITYAVPGTVKTIAGKAFCNAANLETVEFLSDGRLGQSAFAGCRNLKEVFLGKKTEGTALRPFTGCSAELKVYAYSENTALENLKQQGVDAQAYEAPKTAAAVSTLAVPVRQEAEFSMRIFHGVPAQDEYTCQWYCMDRNGNTKAVTSEQHVDLRKDSPSTTITYTLPGSSVTKKASGVSVWVCEQ